MGLQHIEHFQAFCFPCRRTTTQNITYRSYSSYTAHKVHCQECGAERLTTNEQTAFIRQQNEQYDKHGSGPSPRSTYRY